MDYTGAPENITIVWETDNCSYQRKSAEHFRDCQQLANLWLRTIVQIWGMLVMGKERWTMLAVWPKLQREEQCR